MVEITPSQKREAKGRIIANLDFFLDEEARQINGSPLKLQRYRALLDQRNYIARIFGCREIQPNIKHIEAECKGGSNYVH